jgi:polysaccharide export outer membrane protein
MKKIVLSVCALLAAAFITTDVSAQDGYRISPGDVLSVEVVQDPDLNREVLVLPDGSVNFPFAGTVQASGLTTGQVASQIATGIAPNFAVQPSVFVNVRQLADRPAATGGGVIAARTIDVYFLGEVADPGVQEVSPGTTLLQGLSLGGGFTNFAATRRIQLRRTNPHTGETSVVTLDYRAVADGGVLRNDPVLADGDIILVPERRLFE